MEEKLGPKMNAVLFHGPKDIRFEAVYMPEIAENELLVKVEAALTGGTDVKTYLRGHPKIIKSLPSSFGYEFAGTIVKSKNSIFEPGQRVISANTAPCFKCFFCQKEEFSQCIELDFLNGSFAEFIKIPASIAKYNTYKIADEISAKTAAASQTLAVCLHGFVKSNIKDNDVVLIYGLGAIGQTYIKLCKHFLPKATIVGVARTQLKKNLALENGADYVYTPEQLDEFKTKYPYGADVVIEAAGAKETWQKSLQLVRPGGLVNFFSGLPKEENIELSTFQLHYQELKLIGVFHHSPEFMRQAVSLINNGKINLDNLITHSMKLEDLEQALQLMQKGEAMKVEIKAS